MFADLFSGRPDPYSETSDETEKTRSFEGLLNDQLESSRDLDQDFEWEDLLADAGEMSTGEEGDGLPEHMEEVKLDEVLAIDEDAFLEIEGDAHLEDKIAASSLDDLMDELIYDEKDLKRKEAAQEEEGFIEMMEGLGFDRRNMLAETEDLTEETLVAAQPMLDAERMFQGGMTLYQSGQYRDAVHEFERVLEINPRDGSAYQCLGDAYFRLGEMEEAKSAYEEARSLLPENVNVLENLGVIFANMGEYKKAVWQWGEVLKLHPERKDIIQRIKKMQRMIRQRYL
jgi:tetratricopeptide (TPR) repeat protein